MKINTKINILLLACIVCLSYAIYVVVQLDVPTKTVSHICNMKNNDMINESQIQEIRDCSNIDFMITSSYTQITQKVHGYGGFIADNIKSVEYENMNCVIIHHTSTKIQNQQFLKE